MRRENSNFIVLSRGRTASTFFMDGLDQHPEIHACRELFHPHNPVPINEEVYSDSEDSWQFLERNLFLNKGIPKPIRGFKLFYFHAKSTPQARSVWEKIELADNVKFIALSRENTFAAFVSAARARKQGFWHPLNKTYDYSERISVLIDIPRLKASLNAAAEQFAWGHEFVTQRSGLHISYEDLRDQAEDTFWKTVDFLGGARMPVTFPEFSATSEGRSYTQIENIEEVRKFLAERGEEWMVEPYLDD